MTAGTLSLSPPQPRGSAALTVGFGITVAMWGVGYVGRLPALLLPSPLLLGLLLATLIAGGAYLGRSGFGASAGALAGALAGTLNLLVLGSFLAGDRPNQVAPSALLWIPLSVALSALLAALGAGLGARWLPAVAARDNWPGAFVTVAIAATFLLLAVGGLVTSADAGLAVVDWPNSYGYNMFLYPFSKMTGGIYYEHAHRLFGALVGLTTLILALFLQGSDPRRWVRRLGWLALAMVVVQGILGGLRVTGRFTLSASPEAVAPNLTLALIHGVLAQVFLGTLVALGVFTSTTWRHPPATLVRSSGRTDRALGLLLLALLLVQLLLGASQRHLQQLLYAHMIHGIGLVTPLSIHLGMRAWGLNEGVPLLQRLGLLLAGGIFAQLLLGFVAFAVTGVDAAGGEPTGLALVVATAHQWTGAALLALTVALTCWSWRLVRPAA